MLDTLYIRREQWQLWLRGNVRQAACTDNPCRAELRMQNALSKQFISTLAAANGIQIPEERLELVLRQYEAFMQTVVEINSLPLPRETEPAISFTFPSLLSP